MLASYAYVAMPLFLFAISLWFIQHAAARVRGKISWPWIVFLAPVNGISLIWGAALSSRLVDEGELPAAVLEMSLRIGVPLFICLGIPLAIYAGTAWRTPKKG